MEDGRKFWPIFWLISDEPMFFKSSFCEISFERVSVGFALKFFGSLVSNHFYIFLLSSATICTILSFLFAMSIQG